MSSTPSRRTSQRIRSSTRRFASSSSALTQTTPIPIQPTTTAAAAPAATTTATTGAAAAIATTVNTATVAAAATATLASVATTATVAAAAAADTSAGATRKRKASECPNAPCIWERRYQRLSKTHHEVLQKVKVVLKGVDGIKKETRALAWAVNDFVQLGLMLDTDIESSFDASAYQAIVDTAKEWKVVIQSIMKRTGADDDVDANSDDDDDAEDSGDKSAT